MDRFLHRVFFDRTCDRFRAYLAIVWILGLLAGVFSSVSAGDSLLPTMRAALYCGVSISGLLTVTLLPLLFSALAVYISKPFLLLPIAFSKGFLYAFWAGGILRLFGASGWLMKLLLLFGDAASLPILWWYWLKASDRFSRRKYRQFLVASAAAAAVSCFDYFFVSSFLTELITF